MLRTRSRARPREWLAGVDPTSSKGVGGIFDRQKIGKSGSGLIKERVQWDRLEWLLNREMEEHWLRSPTTRETSLVSKEGKEKRKKQRNKRGTAEKMSRKENRKKGRQR